MKRSLYPMLLMLLVLLLIPGWAAAATTAQDQPVNLIIGGQAVTPDVPPVIKGGRTLVPVRVIAEGLGAEVDWNAEKKTAEITRNGQKLVLTLNSRQAVVNGKPVQLDTPPVINQQRMLLPLRFVGESLGITVGWENNNRTVIANETPQAALNGQKAPEAVKFYQVNDTLYMTAQTIADQFGLKNHSWKRPERGLNMDGLLALPLDQMESELGGTFTWSQKKNQVEIERISYLTDVKQKGETVHIQTTLPVGSEAIVLNGPHRIVLDLPQTVLDEDLVPLSYGNKEASTAEKESDEADESTDEDGQAVEDEDQTAEAVQADKDVEPVQDELVSDLRFSQFHSSPNTVRVVIELNQKSKYNLTYTDRGIEVQLIPQPRKTGYLIVVDAGHGGKDPGALGVTGNHEKDYTLAVANKTVELLKQYPEFQVVSTRSTDVFLELSERVAIANDWDADLFLSIHANSFSNPKSGGTESFYYNANSKEFAQLVHKHLQGATGFQDRGVKSSGFYVIKHTKMPAVLTETGFLSNPAENSKLTSPAFQEKIAKSLVAAIREYYQSYQ